MPISLLNGILKHKINFTLIYFTTLTQTKQYKMEFWIKTGQLILSLSILVVLHELGHFIPARYFKTRVDKFYLFFDAGFSLFKFKKGDTEYGIGWLPLGGYVKIAGMIDESMDTEHIGKEPEPWEFRAKPAWQRLIIMSGGVIVNFILAFVIYAMILFVWGEDYLPNESLPDGMAVHDEFKPFGFKDGDKIVAINGEAVEDITDINKLLFIRGYREVDVIHKDGTKEHITLPEGTDQMMFQKNAMHAFTPLFKSTIDSAIVNMPAYEAGLQKGDSILKIDNTPTPYWNNISEALKNKKNTTVDVTYKRGEEVKTTTLTTDSLGHIGVMAQNFIQQLKNDGKIKHKKYSLTESFAGGFHNAYWALKDYISQFKFIFTKKGSTAVGGFASIGKLFNPVWNWADFWATTAFLSIMLAFMNLLPIPALDGGHIAFLLYEIIAGKAPSEKFLTNAQIVGMVIILGLFIYSNGLDLLRGLGIIGS